MSSQETLSPNIDYSDDEPGTQSTWKPASKRAQSSVTPDADVFMQPGSSIRPLDSRCIHVDLEPDTSSEDDVDASAPAHIQTSSRPYMMVGGGLTSVVQVNDTHMNGAHVARRTS